MAITIAEPATFRQGRPHALPAKSAEITAARSTSASGYRTATVIGCTALCLIFMESAVRLRAYLRHGSASVVADIYQPTTTGETTNAHRQLRPYAVIEGNQRYVTINRHGFRGTPPIAARTPQTLRVVVLGDSASFGMEASHDHATWPAQLKRLLRHDAQHDANVWFTQAEVLNFSTPGYTTADSLRMVQEQLPAYQPDVVILYQVSTDLSAAARQSERTSEATATQPHAIQRWVESTSLLYHLVRVNTASWLAVRTSTQQEETGITPDMADGYRDRLEAIRQHCLTNGYRLVVCTAPRAFGNPATQRDSYRLAASALAANPMLTLPQLNESYALFNDTVRAFSRDKAMALVDLDYVFSQQPHRFTDAVHLSDAGHRDVAEMIHRTMRRHADRRAVYTARSRGHD